MLLYNGFIFFNGLINKFSKFPILIANMEITDRYNPYKQKLIRARNNF